MSYNNILLITVLFISTSFFAQSNITTRQIKEVTFKQRGHKLGYEHGKALKIEIGQIVEKWKKNTAKQFGKNPEDILKEFFEQTHFYETIEKLTPELYAEVKGIAEGSGQALNDIMVLNLLDEFWVYIDELYNHHCSDVGVPSINGSTSYIAQNMDIESYTDGYQTLIRLERTPNSPEQLLLTHPGLIVLNGMNEEGVGVVVNTIMQLQASKKGLPVAFVIRKIIDTTNKEELLTFIQNVNHASGQNYIIGIRGEVFDFEASANKVVQYNPNNENGTVYHTNHPIVNDDLKPWYSQFMPTDENIDKLKDSNSYLRISALEKRMVSNPIVTDAIIMETLRSKDDAKNPVCRSNEGRGFTFASVIMTLTGNLNFQVTAGPPDESEYKSYAFSSK
jgi:hypothetical protein